LLFLNHYNRESAGFQGNKERDYFGSNWDGMKAEAEKDFSGELSKIADSSF
jgi:hypothetical protein